MCFINRNKVDLKKTKNINNTEPIEMKNKKGY